jgi:DNA-binding CsgD family transcriptional regulator
MREGSRLTPREQQILNLIGEGKTTKEIATTLNLSTETVGNHRKALCRKLDAHSTAALVCRAARSGG